MVSSSAQAVTTNYCRTGDLNPKYLFLTLWWLEVPGEEAIVVGVW